jgi:hypothetical protein
MISDMEIADKYGIDATEVRTPFWQILNRNDKNA